MSLFWYGAYFRPVGYATVPKGYVDVQSHPDFRFGMVAYEEPLSKEQIRGYELTPIISDGELADLVIEETGLDEYQEKWLALYEDDPKYLEITVGQAISKLGYQTDRKRIVPLVLARLRGAKTNPPEGSSLAKKAEAYWQDLQRRRREALVRAREIIHIGGEYHLGDDRFAMVLPDAVEPGRVRILFFDACGFSGHDTYDTLEELIDEFSKYHSEAVPVTGVLNRLYGTPEWIEGMMHVEFIQAGNTLGYRRQYDLRRALDVFRAHRGLKDAVRLIRRWLSRMVEGEVPPELEEFVE